MTIDETFQLALERHRAGDLPRAEALYREVLVQQPNHVEALHLFGVIAGQIGRLDAAIELIRRAVQLRPDFPEAHNNLGNALKRSGQLDAAESAYRKALGLKPDYAEASVNLGNALRDVGRLDEAIAACREAMRLRPDLAGAHSNLILTLHYHPDYDGSMIHEELLRWNARHGEPLKKFIGPHDNDREPERRLRIGYVSPDFREHVVGQNLLPLLREHDHRRYEIFCYSSVLNPDALTQEIRGCADVWREAVAMSDAQLADQVRTDRIDILVELSNHSADNRLVMMARKPAPVQASWLGYPGSTGVEAITYRISDPQIDPTDVDFPFYSEQTIRLADVYWCYGVPGATPEPAERPALAGGPITFGCLNNFAKVSTASQDLWAEILRGLPGSRLIIHSYAGSHLETVRQRFAAKGISADRIEFVHRQAWAQYVQTYSRIDIALDPFPWGGGITTCNALWMGVPVVTLFGRTAVGRGSATILSSIDAPELIARSPEEYIQIANDLAHDLPRLKELSASLRQRMLGSPLMDAPRFARSVETVYRQMWQTWLRSFGK
jgi:protein O-GlcNAc transferase